MVVGTTDVNVEVKGQCSSRAVLVSSVKGRITMFCQTKSTHFRFQGKKFGIYQV